MQLISLPAPWTLALCFIGWFVFQSGAAWLCFHMPDPWFKADRFPFRATRWEADGRLFAFLHVQRWKRWLPDGAAVVSGGYRKKNLTDFSAENLERFVVESCRGELTHLLAIFPFWVFGFIGPPILLWIMLAYALAVNAPCIIAQRYNRPRIQRLLKLYQCRGSAR
mgnify:CR=1 FL=1